MQTGARSISVVAIRAFDHDGRLIHRGEAVDVSPLEAAVLAQKRRVSLDPRRRPTYQTRELVPAEPEVLVMATTIEPDPEPEPPVEPTVKRRRGRPRKQPITA